MAGRAHKIFSFLLITSFFNLLKCLMIIDLFRKIIEEKKKFGEDLMIYKWQLFK